MRDPLRRLSAVVACLVAVFLVWGAPASAADADVAFTPSDPRLTAVVGMAGDADHGVYWLANGGGSATTAVYAVRPDGRTAARSVFNVPSTDVQAVAYRAGKVFLADIGDAKLARKTVTVVTATVTGLVDGTVAYKTMEFTYPDGAHDAEAMLVGPNDQIYFVTKGASPGVYRAPAAPVTTKANALTRVADAPAGVTDATYLPSGRVALRTAGEVFEIDPATWQTIASAALPAQKDGRSLSTTLDGTGLLAGDQGNGAPVLSVRLPSAPTPPASAAPSSAASASPSPSATEAAQPAGEHSDQSGTLFALVAAGLVAIIAGAYTLIRR